MVASQTERTSHAIFSTYAGEPGLDEIIASFVETMPEKQQNLKSLYENEDVDELRTFAHQLKGSGGGYGFDGLTETARHLEDACKANDIDQVGRALDELIGVMDRITC